MRLARVFFLAAVLITFVSCAPTLKEKKDNAAIRYKMGAVHFSEGNYTAALKDLIEAVELNPEEPTYQHLLGLTYFSKRMYNEAVVHYKEAVRLDPEYADAHVNLGVAYLRLERWDDAIVHFNKALENVFYRTPEMALYNLGSAYYGKGDYIRAVEYFKEAVRVDPEYAFAYNNLGLAYDKLNMTDKAVASYRKAISHEPLFVAAYYNLGVALLKKKDGTGALKAFEKVVELAPQSNKARSAREYIELLR